MRGVKWGIAERRQVIDLVFPRAVVTEFLSLVAICPRCGRKLRTPFPEGVNAPVCYGPNIQALVAYLSEAMCISVCRIRELFSELFGIKISEGTICNIIQAVKKKGTPAYKAIHDMIEHEKVIGADETGENINGALRWLWAFQSDRLTSEKLQVIADLLRPYGIQVWLSINFGSPLALHETKTADPLDITVQRWWQRKAREIYKLIPDFGGFLVKANSEGQPWAR